MKRGQLFKDNRRAAEGAREVHCNILLNSVSAEKYFKAVLDLTRGLLDAGV